MGVGKSCGFILATTKERLTAMQVTNFRTKGYRPDGGGLYLQISQAGTKSWVFRYTLNGRAREMGLGSLDLTSLKDARNKRDHFKKLLKDQGIDPIESLRQTKRENSHASGMTFDECAKAYIDAKSVEWKNLKHRQQWTNTIQQHASRFIGNRNVAVIDTALVMEVLKPIWYTNTETASRLRGRIELILEWAKTSGHRTGENPARWKGHLSNLLSAKKKTQKVKHHAALPYGQINAFINDLRLQGGDAVKALELLILTGVRTGEMIGARWDEFDREQALWTIPASRMKMEKEHRVPLSDRAIAIIDEMAQMRRGEHVFASRVVGRPISNMAMATVLRRMGRDDITVHGFRSSFRTWAGAETNIPREIAEAALAHDIRTEVEAAYQRGDLLDKRRGLMELWANYCAQPAIKKTATVTTINRAAG